METTEDYKVLLEKATQHIAFLEYELGNLKRLVYGSKVSPRPTTHCPKLTASVFLQKQ
jgi:hypothetical protein